MQRHEHMDHAKDVANVNVQREMKVSDDYAYYSPKLFKMLSEFKCLGTVTSDRLGQPRT